MSKSTSLFSASFKRNNMESATFQALKKRFDIFCTIGMAIPVFHAVGQILLQSFLKLDEVNMVFTNGFGFSMMYGSSTLTSILFANGNNDAKGLTTVSAVITIVLVIGFILLSSAMIKGKKIMPLLALTIYAVDTICAMIAIILSSLHVTQLSLSVLEMVFLMVCHGSFLGVYLYLFFARRRLNNFEIEQ